MAGWTAAAMVGVGAIAQVAAAAFTGVMAQKTHDLATKTSDMANETKRAAAATEVESEATRALVEESRLDREVSWSPFLAVRVKKKRPLTFSVEVVKITNFGRGPALNGIYVSRIEGIEWCWAPFDGIAGEGGSRVLTTIRENGNFPAELLGPSPGDPDQTSRFVEAVLCEDVFGNRIRFAIGRTGRDVSRRTDANRPAWAGTVRVKPWTWSFQSDADSGHAPPVHEAGSEPQLP
jgi:hypothetical protein